MLVLTPKKRYTIQQIKQHKWMLSGDGPPKPPPPSCIQGHDPQAGEFNDQILRIMHQLGIDQLKTLEVGTTAAVLSVLMSRSMSS